MHRLQSFFIGRNGSDALSRAMSITACVSVVLSMIFSRILGKVGGFLGNILWILALVLLVLSYFRMFSKNIPARQRENQKYLELVAPLKKKLAYLRLRRQQRNIYAFFKCPTCGMVLRVPKGKGHVRITCKGCHEKFERKS